MLPEVSRRPFFHDGIERPLTRPKDSAEQRACYSGKKRRHALKNVLPGASTGSVLLLSDTHKGSCHDKPIADQTPYPLPAGSELLQDLGFVGFTLTGVAITQPRKKPRGKALIDEQKAENCVIAARRVLIEHIIRRIERCRIVKDTIRLWKDTARVMVIDCMLWFT